MFLAEFSKYCDKRQKEVGVRLTQLTANKYHRLLRYMTEYTKEQYRKDDLPLDAIDYAYIDGLNTFMQTAHNCRNNGAVNLLCCLKNFILYAIRNEWMEKNPFRYYKMKVDKTNVKVPLTREELDTLLRKPMPNDRLSRIRDVFCFCALTGLAFTDADHLRKEHITTDEEGTVWIHKPREKTAVMSRVPLLPQAIRILKRYESDETCKSRGKLLPVPSNSKMNAYLKELAGICNIPKNLTTHTARHTFATLLAWFVAQVLKTLINFILLGKFQLERMWGDGGMPSAHSATVCAMVIATARCEGIDSAIFAVACVVAIITMHDAMGVRHETGEQAKVLNQMIDQWIEVSEKNAPFLQNMHLKEMVGHTPLQVVAGFLVGLVVGLLYPLGL